MKVISKDEEAKKILMEGITLVGDIVGSTLGPKGRNVVLDRGFSTPIVTNDGVSIARSIEVEGDLLRQAVGLIQEVAQKTNEEAGDGTTTSISLAVAMAKEGVKYSENPMEIRESITLAGEKALAELKKMSKPIKDKKDILSIATISAESKEIGQIIADTIDAIGKNGKIEVEESKMPFIDSKIVEGYEIPKGFVSPWMINKDNKKSEYKEVHVLVFGGRMSNISDFLPFLQKISLKTKELVIFCDDIDASVTNTFIANKQASMFSTLVVKAGSQNNEVLEDIATVTGATYISKEAGFELDKIGMEVLGKAQRIVSTEKKTVILNGYGKTKEKVAQYKKELASCTDDNEYDLIENRLARLQGGIAVISVGAKTEQEMRYLYYKVEDAVNATKSAIEEGVVPGGGMTLFQISKKLTGNTIGERIMRAALKAPLKQIISNAWLDYSDIVGNMPKGMGYDAKNNKYVNMVKSGIIDPAKVERCCIENAVSFTGVFLTIQHIVALKKEIPKENE